MIVKQTNNNRQKNPTIGDIFNKAGIKESPWPWKMYGHSQIM